MTQIWIKCEYMFNKINSFVFQKELVDAKQSPEDVQVGVLVYSGVPISYPSSDLFTSVCHQLSIAFYNIGFA